MKYLGLEQVIAIHRAVIAESGGDASIRDRGGLESAVAQPRMTAFGQACYPTLAKKAAAMAFSLNQESPVPRREQADGHHVRDRVPLS